MNRPTRSLLLSFGCQICGAASALACIRLGLINHELIIIFIAAVSALIIGKIAQLSWPWLAFNFSLPFSVALVIGAEDGGLWIGGLALGLALLYLPTFVSGVPYYISHKKVFEAVKDQLPIDKDFTFIDLGCGNGALLCFLAHHFKHGKFIGVELSPLALLFCHARRLCGGHENIEIKFKNIWEFKLNQADFVYAFLAPPVMPQLNSKLSAEMKKGSTAIVNAFPLPRNSDHEIAFANDPRSHLYMYRF